MKCQESPGKYKEYIIIIMVIIIIIIIMYSYLQEPTKIQGQEHCVVFFPAENTEEVPPAALLGLFVEVLPLPFQGFTCTVCGRYLWSWDLGKMMSIFNGIKSEYCKTV